MKYKVGDRVRIVSEVTKKMNWIDEMDVYLGKVMTIRKIVGELFLGSKYKMTEDKGDWFWDDSMITGLASEVPFDFKVWKDKKICMHCKTKEEAEDFCKAMDKAGLKWSSGTSYLEMSCFRTHENHTCYYFNKGTYDSVSLAENKGSQILEWSDYRSTDPPKEEQEKVMETKIDDKPLSYQEAVTIFERLCESRSGENSCSECPVGSRENQVDKPCRDFLLENPDKAESILKKWAAEHPVKTNGQKCKEMFLEVFGMQYATALMHPDWWYQEYVEPEN